MSEFKLFNGDCREVMAEFEYRTFDSVVCDPPYGLEFMGSGSTGVAAIEEGFNFYGIELDNSYYQIAESRIRSEQKSEFD